MHLASWKHSSKRRKRVIEVSAQRNVQNMVPSENQFSKYERNNEKGMDSFDYLHALANNHATTLQIRKLKTVLSLVY